MNEKKRLLQDKIRQELESFGTIASVTEEEVSKHFDAEEDYICGFRLTEGLEATNPEGTYILFLAEKKEGEVFCRIANGILRSLTPEITDRICKELEEVR